MDTDPSVLVRFGSVFTMFRNDLICNTWISVIGVVDLNTPFPNGWIRIFLDDPDPQHCSGISVIRVVSLDPIKNKLYGSGFNFSK